MFVPLKIYTTFLILMNLNSAFSQETEAPIVALRQGQIQGHVLVSPQGGKTYYAYQDIPYASPPVGELRFHEPVEPESWDGVLNTTHNSHSCYLNGHVDELAPDVTESEDCLYLNVYTTVKPGSGSDPLPVLFWIHGGGFYFGDGTFQVYGPQFLIDYDIVIVTFNYRLGAFGFLTTEDGVIPGNLGLKDQNFALKWVNQNIELFGGDPSKITIDGESAGGASVGYHVISKKSAGLFRGAILQSGTAICSFAHQDYARYFAFKLGSTLDPNFTSDNSTALLELLRSASATDINDISLEVPDDKTMGLGDKGLVWVPVIESEEFDSAFITGPMHENIRTGNINRVPILIGYNSEEELAFLGDGDSTRELAVNIDNDPSKGVNKEYNMTDENKPIAGLMLRYLYTTGSFQQNFSAIVQYLTDIGFSTPIIRHAELQSHYANVFLYQFSYKGLMGRSNTTVEGTDLVGHAEDLKYLWHIDRLDDGTVFPDEDYLTQKRLLTLWSNFVKYLMPTPEEDPLFDNLIWPTVSAGNIAYLNINNTLEVRTQPRRYQQFKTIVNRYAVPPLNSY